jgi:hypothetical protein
MRLLPDQPRRSRSSYPAASATDRRGTGREIAVDETQDEEVPVEEAPVDERPSDEPPVEEAIAADASVDVDATLPEPSRPTRAKPPPSNRLPVAVEATADEAHGPRRHRT